MHPPGGHALLACADHSQPFLCCASCCLCCPAGWLQLNDPLTRALLFVPLFTLLVVRLHRNTLAGSPGLTGVLSQPLLTYLVRCWLAVPHA